MSNRFSHICRIKDSKEFSNVFDGAKRRRFPYGVVFIQANTKQQPARLGVSVAKRSFKKAHDRNRWKRLVRESFRVHQNCFSGIDIVVVVRKEAEQCTNQTFLKSLAGVWQQLTR